MAWLSAIKAGASAIFGGSPTGGLEVVKGVGNWIDGQQFTEQEQAENALERAKLYNGFLKQVMDENTTRSLTRRSIAIWIIRAELTLLFLSVLMFKIDPGFSEYIYNVATGEPLNMLVLGVAAFFFGTHMLRSAKND